MLFKTKIDIHNIWILLNKNIESYPKFYVDGLWMMFLDDYLNPHIDKSYDSTRSCDAERIKP